MNDYQINKKALLEDPVSQEVIMLVSNTNILISHLKQAFPTVTGLLDSATIDIKMLVERKTKEFETKVLSGYGPRATTLRQIEQVLPNNIDLSEMDTGLTRPFSAETYIKNNLPYLYETVHIDKVNFIDYINFTLVESLASAHWFSSVDPEKLDPEQKKYFHSNMFDEKYNGEC